MQKTPELHCANKTFQSDTHLKLPAGSDKILKLFSPEG